MRSQICFNHFSACLVWSRHLNHQRGETWTKLCLDQMNLWRVCIVYMTAVATRDDTRWHSHGLTSHPPACLLGSLMCVDITRLGHRGVSSRPPSPFLSRELAGFSCLGDSWDNSAGAVFQANAPLSQALIGTLIGHCPGRLAEIAAMKLAWVLWDLWPGADRYCHMFL